MRVMQDLWVYVFRLKYGDNGKNVAEMSCRRAGESRGTSVSYNFANAARNSVTPETQMAVAVHAQTSSFVGKSNLSEQDNLSSWHSHLSKDVER